MELTEREILTISGKDACDFLQKIVTQKIHLDMNYSYSLILTPIGRYLLDFFIFTIDSIFFIDIDKFHSDTFISTLNKYKFRADFDIKKTDLKVYFFEKIDDEKIDKNDFLKISKDPRNENFGYRCISQNKNPYNNSLNEYQNYNTRRILFCFPEKEDFISERTIPIEYNISDLNGIAFGKGCYVGQEFTNRSHSISVVRKKLARIIIQKSDEVSLKSQYKINFDKNKPISISNLLNEELVQIKSSLKIDNNIDTNLLPLHLAQIDLHDSYLCLGLAKIDLINQLIDLDGFKVNIF